MRLVSEPLIACILLSHPPNSFFSHSTLPRCVYHLQSVHRPFTLCHASRHPEPDAQVRDKLSDEHGIDVEVSTNKSLIKRYVDEFVATK
jgi:hypothetical protein